MRYIDLHCDTLLKCHLDGIVLRENSVHLDLVRAKKAGLMAQFMAIFTPTHDIAEQYGITQGPGDFFDTCMEVYKRELVANDDLIMPALSAQDIADNNLAGKMSSILTLEDGAIVGGDLRRLDALHGLGVRLITLTWNYVNCFGYPQSKDADAMKLGLKPFGIDAVRHMNDLGIIVDVSHLSAGGFYDVAWHSKKPFCASHSCCRALCDVSRNLTDDQLKALGNRGGVCGMNFAPLFLEKGSMYAKIDTIVRHMKHVADKAGIGAVAFGSDFDGIPGELELGGCEGMPLLIDALGKEFKESEIEMICSGNALRLIGECLHIN